MSHHHHHSDTTAESWRVDLQFGADDDTVATAQLTINDEIYEATGHTHIVPFDTTIARELAVARALSGLAHQLVDDATRKVGRLAEAVSDAADEAAAAYAELDS